MNDWRWTIGKLVFLMIPVVGIWNWATHYRIECREEMVQVESLAGHVTKELQRVRFEFAPEQLANVKILSRSRAIAFSDDRQSAVLFTKKSKGPSLPEYFASGSIAGLVDSNHLVSVDWLNVQGCDLPEEFGPVLWVDVDRSYLSSILAVTGLFVVLGGIALFWIYLKVDDRRFDNQNSRIGVESEVALQLSIARHQTYQR